MKAYLSQRQRGFRRASIASATPPPLLNAGPPERPGALRKRPGDLTEQEIRMSLEKHRGNKTRVAAELGIAVNTLKARMRAFGIAT
ncbi:regulatory protein, Fis family [Stigmatella aurantiaca]|uniref:Regulatory protein, Fis family n=1 Tax=Stigmatella aurantiaca TaxID=41 RepID=A0A1H7X186_STIAU|nr:helix-turn-helix domain-containing protein [Stigmatella aurantiaca]SEM27355.1 regulatory protein, Fis family [Stigmatella aurantiaca]